jgi:hypothetical protein
VEEVFFRQKGNGVKEILLILNLRRIVLMWSKSHELKFSTIQILKAKDYNSRLETKRVIFNCSRYNLMQLPPQLSQFYTFYYAFRHSNRHQLYARTAHAHSSQLTGKSQCKTQQSSRNTSLHRILKGAPPKFKKEAHTERHFWRQVPLSM